MRSDGTTAALLLLVAAGACVGLPPEPPGQVTAGSTGPSVSPTATTGSTTAADASTSPSTGADDTAGTSGPGQSTSDGVGSGSSTGEPGPTLVDAGLVSRWHIDEAAMGQDPPVLLDAAMPGDDLTIVYQKSSPVFEEVGGHRGLAWSFQGIDGQAQLAMVGATNLYQGLVQQRTITIELVVEVDAVVGNGSRLFHMGQGTNAGQLSLRVDELTRLDVVWANEPVRTFDVELDGARQVIHVVIDTQQRLALDRVRAYVDGMPQRLASLDARPALDEGLELSPFSAFVLGNRTTGNRSFRGTLFYAAVYAEAFTADQVQHDTALLLEDDDTP